MNRRPVSRVPVVVGVALIGLASAVRPVWDELLKRFSALGELPWLATLASWLAVALAAAGVVSLVLFVVLVLNVGDLLRILRLRVGAWLLGAIDATVAYELVVARVTDLKPTRDFCLRNIGPGLSPLKKMRRWHAHNSKIFWILVPTQPEDGVAIDYIQSIHGYFGIIPINSAACKALDEEQLDGISFTTDHICAEAEAPAAYYIAGVAAEHKIARIKILRKLKQHLERLVSVQAQLFYTRPISRSGLDLVESFRFTRVDKQPEIALNEIHQKVISRSDLHGLRA